ncbi:MAG: hypothetical protein HZA48_03115 [Planctomycetes bacterium]|nr:hypothetical protein [Planctomycetota bacterium]
MAAPKKTKRTMNFSYSKEVIRKYRDSSTEWKLNWLEEINSLTFKVLGPKEKRFRERFRKGLIRI